MHYLFQAMIIHTVISIIKFYTEVTCNLSYIKSKEFTICYGLVNDLQYQVLTRHYKTKIPTVECKTRNIQQWRSPYESTCVFIINRHHLLMNFLCNEMTRKLYFFY